MGSGRSCSMSISKRADSRASFMRRRWTMLRATTTTTSKTSPHTAEMAPMTSGEARISAADRGPDEAPATATKCTSSWAPAFGALALALALALPAPGPGAFAWASHVSPASVLRQSMCAPSTRRPARLPVSGSAPVAGASPAKVTCATPEAAACGPDPMRVVLLLATSRWSWQRTGPGGAAAAPTACGASTRKSPTRNSSHGRAPTRWKVVLKVRPGASARGCCWARLPAVGRGNSTRMGLMLETTPSTRGTAPAGGRAGGQGKGGIRVRARPPGHGR